MSLDNLVSGVQSISNLASTGQSLVNRLAGNAGASGDDSWRARLKPAKFRGKPFAVLEGQVRFGRNVVIHEYPFRDGVWVEDLGRTARRISFSGFIVGDDAVARRAELMRACEEPAAIDNAELEHPTLGNIKVALAGEVTSVERWDRGRMFELTFSFVEQGSRRFPGVAVATENAVVNAAAVAKNAATQSFLKTALTALKHGVATITQLANTVAIWARTVQRFVNDATNLFHLVRSLPGEFGRFFGGTGRTVRPAAIVSDLIALGALRRMAVNQSSQQLSGAVAVLAPLSGGRADPVTVATALTEVAKAAHTVTAATLAALPVTVGAVRLIDGLIAATSALPDGVPALRKSLNNSVPTSSAQASIRIGIVATDLLRRSIVIEAALSSSRFQPVSYDEAVTVKNLVVAWLDAEIVIAADQAEDDVVSAMRSLRTAVLQDLTARGANLAPLMQVSTPLPMPALALAQRFYRDGARVDDVVSRGDPIHPAFMPVTMTLLGQ